MGIIKKVKYDPKTEEGEAAVLFDKNPKAERVWQDLKDGNAFYVSPAIAGEFVEVDGERIYQDWFGLHLARVANPAYGVFHASIKATCEGDEKKCIQNLIATASVLLESNDTFNFTGFSCANNMSMLENKKTDTSNDTPFEDTDAGKAIASLAAEIKDVKDSVKKVETSFEKLPDTAPDPSPKGQLVPVKDPNSDSSQSQAAIDEKVQTATDEKIQEQATEIEKLKEVSQANEDDLKTRLATDVVESETSEGELMDEVPKTAAEDETRVAELKEMETASLKALSISAAASLQKVSAMASKFGKTSVATNLHSKVRLVHTPGVGTASKNNNGYKNLRDIKKRWL